MCDYQHQKEKKFCSVENKKLIITSQLLEANFVNSFKLFFFFSCNFVNCFKLFFFSLFAVNSSICQVSVLARWL